MAMLKNNLTTRSVPKWKARANAIIHAFASLKIAVALIVMLVVFFFYGTILEARYGRPYSQWFVYHSPWFFGLMVLLAASAFCAAYVRFPWKRNQTGFVITHAGLLMLLSGWMISYWRGIEGQIVLVEGRSTDQLTLNDRSQLAVYRTDQPKVRPFVFAFEGGPLDWKDDTTLSLGSVDGMSARVLHYYHCSQPVEDWIADSEKHSGPLVRFQLQMPHGDVEAPNSKPTPPITGFLADRDFGDEVLFGPVAIRLQRAVSDAMVNDFLHPPNVGLGENGMLTVYYKDSVEHVSVDRHVGQTVTIGHTGAKVELVQYLSDAKLDATGKFRSVDNQARNPLVELNIKLPSDERTYRQVAFAKSPLLNLDGVYEHECPVKFTYEHPKIKPKAAIEFLQAADGNLYGRIITNGEYQSCGEVRNLSRIQLHGGLTCTVTDYLPHARREISFKPTKSNTNDQRPNDSAAVEVQISTAGRTDTVWLQRNSPEFQTGTIGTPERTLRVRYTDVRRPLGFFLELISFHQSRDAKPLTSGSYWSTVRLLDLKRHLDEKRLVSTNEPLCHNGFRIVQSSYRDAGHEQVASILSVSYSPGRPWMLAGSLTTCLGIAIMLCLGRASFAQIAK